MDTTFKSIKPNEISDNVFKLIGNDWMLITAGNLNDYNTMTASWGGLGVLWGEPVSFCFVRPQRHTYKFIENSECYTLSFFDEKYRNVLQYCGANSGKNVNKASATGITAVMGEDKSVYFNEARLVIVCQKMYFDDINPENFVDLKIDKNYLNKDYHRMYVGKIKKCLIRK